MFSLKNQVLLNVSTSEECSNVNLTDICVYLIQFVFFVFFNSTTANNWYLCKTCLQFLHQQTLSPSHFKRGRAFTIIIRIFFYQRKNNKLKRTPNGKWQEQRKKMKILSGPFNGRNCRNYSWIHSCNRSIWVGSLQPLSTLMWSNLTVSFFQLKIILNV